MMRRGGKGQRTILAVAGMGAVAGSCLISIVGGETRVLATPPNISSFTKPCSEEFVQSVASGLSDGVKVKAIKFGPFRSGTLLKWDAGKQLAYCQVTGSFITNKATGKTANFLATFPEKWNGKYLQLGCSGHCGQFYVSDPGMPTITVTAQGYGTQIIEKGYASFATDEGHESMDSINWAIAKDGSLDQDMLDDWMFRSQKVLSRMGKEFTTAFYARISGKSAPIKRSYFNGCSGGGRDALVAASYFPEAFDGIIVGSAYNPLGISFQSSAIGQAMKRSAAANIRPAQFATIDRVVKAQCDAVDGVKDGVIQNPAACNFDPERDLPLCKAGETGDQCFSQAQRETVAVAVNAVTDERGNVIQPGFSVSELEAFTADMAMLTDPIHKVFHHRNDPKFELSSIFSYRRGGPGTINGFHAVVPASEVKLAKATLAMGTGHMAENMPRILGSKTKLLIWHNWSDEKLTPYTSINWYQQLARRGGGYAKLQQQARLFMLPGTSHCSITGVAPNSFDSIGALEKWVEDGIPPNALTASVAHRQFLPGAAKAANLASPNWTMPLCKVPEQARYNGKGDVKDGANWSCPAGDRSLLKLGSSGISAGMIH